MKILPPEVMVKRIRDIQAQIRQMVLSHIAEQETEVLSSVAAETEGDTIYAVDRVSEEGLIALFETLSHETAFVLIGEGLAEQGQVFPEGADPDGVPYRIIVDPIDGTRGLMYDKRSAWILTGVAHNRGAQTSLQDIFVAVQTEIPTSKQFRSDVLWAIRDRGYGVEGYNRFNGQPMYVVLKPSTATTIEHGFAMISRFFPGGKDLLAKFEEDLVEKLIGPVVPGKARLFEDQYICSGGQFYELMAGHDRFNADLRPLLEHALIKRGQSLGICCHPYDVCTALIAEEMGVKVTSVIGEHLNAPLNTTHPVAWVAYANEMLQKNIEPLLQEVLHQYGWV